MRLGIRGSVGTRSVAATVERRFYNESLYLGKRLRLPRCIEELPFSFTPCQVLRRGWSDRGRFKGVLRFIAGRRYESNAFAEYFRSYEMRVERRSRRGNLSYLSYRPYLVSFDKRSWTFLPPPPLFLSLVFSHSSSRVFPPPFLRYIPVQDLVLFFASISSPAAFAFVFLSFCRSHLLVDISSFSPPYLRSFQFRPLFVLFLPLSPSTGRSSPATVSFSLAICSPLFNVGR